MRRAWQITALAVATLVQPAIAGQIMYVERQPLSGTATFCATVSRFKKPTNNSRADSFWLAVRFSRDVPYTVKVNGVTKKSKVSATLEEKNIENASGENVFVPVT